MVYRVTYLIYRFSLDYRVGLDYKDFSSIPYGVTYPNIVYRFTSKYRVTYSNIVYNASYSNLVRVLPLGYII